MLTRRLFYPYVLALLCLMPLWSGCDGENAPDPPPRFELIETFDTAGIAEPSGIVYHTGRNALFVAGDKGDVAEYSTNGTFIRAERIRNASFEGITFNPATGLLYVAVEGTEQIIEIEPGQLRSTRVFTVDRTLGGKTVLGDGGQGLEGITFVPDADHPEGGSFFVVNQAPRLGDPEEPSALFEVNLPLSGGTALTGTLTRQYNLEMTDLSGVFYDTGRSRFYLLSDDNNALLEVNPAGSILDTHRLLGQSQEGITLDANGVLYVAQDDGGILKILWNR